MSRVFSSLLARGLGAQRLLLLFVGFDRGRIREPAFDVRSRAHAGARPQEGRPAREARPCLVPQEDEVRLDGKALFHHAARVVHVAVEGAVGEVEQPHAVEPAFVLQVEQCRLDRLQRHRAIHRVLREREGLDIERLAAASAPGRSDATCGSCGRR